LALSREQKVELVEQYAEQLKESKGIILTDYRGLSVGDMQAIRTDMRPLDGRYQVVKNRLLQLALEEVGFSLPEEWLEGPTAVSFCRDEVPSVAKVLKEHAEELGLLEIKGGYLDGDVMSKEQVQSIAELPSREQLLAQVLGGINAPARQTAGVVASGIRQVVNVLQAYVDKLEESGGAEVAAEAA